jgi:hypothetical protein
MARIVELGNGKTFNKGYITLYGSTGKSYTNLALEIPGYGMVPCSMKLKQDFTNLSDNLMLVISEIDDKNAPVTSSIWVTKRNYEVVGIL